MSDNTLQTIIRPICIIAHSTTYRHSVVRDWEIKSVRVMFPKLVDLFRENASYTLLLDAQDISPQLSIEEGVITAENAKVYLSLMVDNGKE